MSIPYPDKVCPKCNKTGYVCYCGLKNVGGYFVKAFSCVAMECKKEWTEECTMKEKEAFN